MTVTTCGIFLLALNTKKVLTCHATNSGWRFWSIPKGLVDRGETNQMAAIRELEEETGLSLAKLEVTHEEVKYLGSSKYQKQNKVLEAFQITIPEEIPKSQLVCHSMVEMKDKDPFPEVNAFAWMSKEDAKLKLHESQVKFLDKIINF